MAVSSCLRERNPAKCHHRLLVLVLGPPSSLNLELLQIRIRTAGDFQEIFDRFWASHYGIVTMGLEKSWQIKIKFNTFHNLLLK